VLRRISIAFHADGILIEFDYDWREFLRSRALIALSLRENFNLTPIYCILPASPLHYDVALRNLYSERNKGYTQSTIGVRDEYARGARFDI